MLPFLPFLAVACTASPKATPVPSVTALSPDMHSDFPISSGAHGGIDCSVCHGEFDTFAQVDCLNGCHAQDVTTASHQGIDGFAYDSQKCLQCHPSGTADGVVPNHPFPIGKMDVHNNMICVQCHTEPANKKIFSCTSGCHAEADTTPLHAGIPNYQYADAQCLACHPNGIADGTGFDHPAFPIGQGTKHTLGCTQCHTDPANRQDLTKLACVTCHATLGSDAQHANKVADYTPSTAGATSATCLACHAESQVYTVAAHTQFSLVFGENVHDTKCLGCHNQKRTDKAYAEDFDKYDCLTCHTQYPNTTQAALLSGHSAVTGYTYSTPACINCHPQGIVAPPADHGQYFPIDAASKHAGVSCTDCHSNLAQPTVATNFLCGTCHQQLDPALITNHTTNTSKPTITVKASEISVTNSATCLRCHGDSQVDLTSSHPRTEPCPNGGAPPHQGAACTRCHSGYRTDKTFAADFGGSPPPGCAQCHQSHLACTP
jgi:hypothetical protein